MICTEYSIDKKDNVNQFNNIYFHTFQLHHQCMVFNMRWCKCTRGASTAMEWSDEEWVIEKYVILNGLTDLQAIAYKSRVLRQQYEHSRIVQEAESASEVETACSSE